MMAIAAQKCRYGYRRRCAVAARGLPGQLHVHLAPLQQGGTERSQAASGQPRYTRSVAAFLSRSARALVDAVGLNVSRAG